MLAMFVIFFFFVYILCDFLKYNIRGSVKGDRRMYNKKIVVVKLAALTVAIILLFIHHFSKGGILDRSYPWYITILYFSILGLLVFVSVRDIKRASFQDKIEREDITR